LNSPDEILDVNTENFENRIFRDKIFDVLQIVFEIEEGNGVRLNLLSIVNAKEAMTNVLLDLFL